MMATHDALAVMPASRVTVLGAVPSLESENDLGIHGSNRATPSHCSMDCRVKPGNDSARLNAGAWLTGLEH